MQKICFAPPKGCVARLWFHSKAWICKGGVNFTTLEGGTEKALVFTHKLCTMRLPAPKLFWY